MGKQKRVFIGTSSRYIRKKVDGSVDIESTENQPIIRKLLYIIEQAGHIPNPWWSGETFKPSDYNLTSLIEATKTNDAGVFIFGADDKFYSEEGKLRAITRSSVILEAGMFFATKGIKGTLILTDIVNENVKGSLKAEEILELIIPSDLSGFNHENIYNSKLNERIRSFLNNDLDKDRAYDKVTYYMGHELVNLRLERRFQEWATKSLYLGTESALIWKRIENTSLHHIRRAALEKFVSKAEKTNKNLSLKDYDNLISFGPGIGKTDEKLVEMLSMKNSNIAFIPVDINPSMAYLAINTVTANQNVRTPFSIIDDFEVNHPHIGKILKSKTKKFGQANFLVMMGLTFSNLQAIESHFLNKVVEWTDSKDLFLLDVLIKGDESIENIEPRRSPENLFVDYEDGIYGDLLINSIRRKFLCSEADRQDSLSIDDFKEIKSNIAKFVKAVPIIDERTIEKYSRVNGTQVLLYRLIYNENGKKINNVLMIAKRYDYFEFGKHLKSYNFEVLKSTLDKKDGRAVFLIKPNDN
ncbi:MAG: TIR domain-containing protein [Reichenbachiella sp.]|uniref:TIR domain-containing protein n=1 Tax=Reichenbachiella sp. TaxID=2184521 RepID=UPI003267EEEF